MKKIIITCLIAIFTITLAYAQSVNFWLSGSNSELPDIVCEGGSSTCNLKYSLPFGTIVFIAPVPDQTSATARILSNYRYDP